LEIMFSMARFSETPVLHAKSFFKSHTFTEWSPLPSSTKLIIKVSPENFEPSQFYFRCVACGGERFFENKAVIRLYAKLAKIDNGNGNAPYEHLKSRKLKLLWWYYNWMHRIGPPLSHLQETSCAPSQNFEGNVLYDENYKLTTSQSLILSPQEAKSFPEGQKETHMMLTWVPWSANVCQRLKLPVPCPIVTCHNFTRESFPPIQWKNW
jgi:hypothetical protein